MRARRAGDGSHALGLVLIAPKSKVDASSGLDAFFAEVCTVFGAMAAFVRWRAIRVVRHQTRVARAEAVLEGVDPP